MSTSGFDTLGLNDSLVETVSQLGYEEPTEIQQNAIPPLIEGQDLLGVSQTGTGKTAAFVLPMLQRLDPKRSEVQILVLTPTRELGIQVSKSFDKYASGVSKFSSACLYGGQDIQIQMRAIKKRPQVVVATPGRLIDHLKRNSLKLDNLCTVILDEADEMLNMGFLEDVEEILESAPDETQMVLFSATMPKGIRRIADNFLTDPVEVKVNQKVKTVDSIEQKYLLIKKHDKREVLERVICSANAEAGIIFVKTKQQTIEVAERLEKIGLSSAPLNGDLQQNMREATVRQLTDGHIDWVVATDVAARGLDVRRISHVINYDLPYDQESYVHRIGRTGRAGRTGTAITLAAPSDMRQLRRVEQHTGATMTKMSVPSGKEVSDLRIEDFTKQLLDVINKKDLKRVLKLVTNIETEHEIDSKTIAAALALMASENKPLYPKFKTIEEASERRGGDRDRDRGERGGRGGRREGGGRDRSFKNGVKYRMSVGKNQRVGAGDIVGAIANEGGLPSSDIGDIRLFHDYSTVELSQSLPDYVLKDLSNIKVRNHSLGLREWKESGGDRGDRGGDRGGRGGDRGGRSYSDRPKKGKFSRDDSRPKKKEYSANTGKKKIRKLPPKS